MAKKNLNLTLEDVIAQETVDLYNQQIIPISDRIVPSADPPRRMLSGEIIPKSMSAPEVEQSIYDQVWSEAEIQKSSEIAKAGKEYWEAVMASAVEMMSSGGMLSDSDKQPDDKLIALSQQQAETNTAQADVNLALANAQISKNVAKDLKEETTKKDSGGRKKPAKIENLRGKKAGWKIVEGSNFWSVDEKDPYWKTQEGYDEGVALYGMKPSFLKAKDVATLIYNPKTGEYDSTKKEEFVDLKPAKRISL